jgi:hypothetical protein
LAIVAVVAGVGVDTEEVGIEVDTEEAVERLVGKVFLFHSACFSQ